MKHKRTIYIIGIFFTIACVTIFMISTYRASGRLQLKGSYGPTAELDGGEKSQPITHVPESNPWAEHNAIAARFDTRVRFWGKVVDQNESPLEGVITVASVTTLRMIKTEHGYREYEILKSTTDSAGRFMFDGSEGMYLDIESMNKDGYVLPSAYQAGTRWSGAKYRYQYLSIGNSRRVFKPVQASPEIFHLWKLRKPEALVIGGDTSGLNGPEIKLNSAAEAYNDISMMITDVGTSQAPQWEVTVAAIDPNGGVVKADPTDIFMFNAPESGYSDSIKFRYGPDGSDQGIGDPGIPIRFFVRSHGGRWHTAGEYLFFSPERNGMTSSKMRYWLNPSGSRNLEHDAAHPLPEPILK